MYNLLRIQVQEGFSDGGDRGGVQEMQVDQAWVLLQQRRHGVQVCPLRHLLLHQWRHRPLRARPEDDHQGHQPRPRHLSPRPWLQRFRCSSFGSGSFTGPCGNGRGFFPLSWFLILSVSVGLVYLVRFKCVRLFFIGL